MSTASLTAELVATFVLGAVFVVGGYVSDTNRDILVAVGGAIIGTAAVMLVSQIVRNRPRPLLRLHVDRGLEATMERKDMTDPRWSELIHGAKQIDLMGAWLSRFVKLRRALEDAVANGCVLRVLIGTEAFAKHRAETESRSDRVPRYWDRRDYWMSLANRFPPGTGAARGSVEVKLSHSDHLYCSYARFDKTCCIVPYLCSVEGGESMLLVVRDEPGSVLFAKYKGEFEDLFRKGGAVGSPPESVDE